eukprot:TRINITY_DN18783_c0_g1_i1.p1 TRINITY_DN18783_c0_g1~~TRINITY_DN18783_c0_g1_i1.p1  ORF type:complete len:579 (+),score=120.35 TRINITY_DN18783_c0_g1_i1:481-2217(+)
MKALIRSPPCAFLDPGAVAASKRSPGLVNLPPAPLTSSDSPSASARSEGCGSGVSCRPRRRPSFAQTASQSLRRPPFSLDLGLPDSRCPASSSSPVQARLSLTPAAAAASPGPEPLLSSPVPSSASGLACPSNPRRPFRGPPAAAAAQRDGGGRASKDRVGVLLLNLGGPETLADVQPFLFNLFADPDIIRLPRLLRFLQRPLAQLISTLRAPKSQEGYAAIGGGSPLRKITMEQAEALREALALKDLPAHVYVGMRYWHPFTEEAISEIKRDGITRLVVLPLYPQFSITTSGSSLRLLEKIFREDSYLVSMQHTVIPSWYQRSGYVESMADLIERELIKFPRQEEANVFFSAHGVPVAYVEEAGDPYKAEMEECVQLIMEELRRRGVNNGHTLAYQSRVGPVEWLKPYTDATIEELGQSGVKSLLAVPISFVSEHIETLEEIDGEYRELAMKSGVEHWGRVPALGCEPRFIRDLADAVLEALPYVGALAPSSCIDARQALVPLGSVEELLATYDVQRRELPPPVAVWEWGWTRSAEMWNGRAAMLAVLALLLLEARSGQGVLLAWRLPSALWGGGPL